MRKTIHNLLFIYAAILLVVACKKKDSPEPPSTLGFVSFHNAALLLPRAGNVLVDNNRVNNANFLSYLASITGNWVGVNEGTRTIALKDSSVSATANWASKAITAQAGKAYSAFAYDTLNATTGQVRMLVLNTDLSTPALGKSNVRFLHLSPDASNVDVALLRVNDARTGYIDSVKINNVPYVGPAPNEAALSAFANIPSGFYHIRVRPAGTFTNVVSVGTTFTTGTSIIQGKNYSIFARGFVNNTGTGRTTATALGATIILHNP
jgi:Domain of unknown function (DUF4397)